MPLLDVLFLWTRAPITGNYRANADLCLGEMQVILLLLEKQTQLYDWTARQLTNQVCSSVTNSIPASGSYTQFLKRVLPGSSHCRVEYINTLLTECCKSVLSL